MMAIQVCPFLEGSKRAVKFDKMVYVSPAMWDLLSHADGNELKHLLANILVLDLGDIPFPFIRANDLPSVEAY